MEKKQEELIREEQKILNDLIQEMDETLLEIDERLTYKKLQSEKAKATCLADAYGMLVFAEDDKMQARQKRNSLIKGRDELYQMRLVLDVTDGYGQEREEVKIGLHTYYNRERIFIMSWKRPLCRHYILDNSSEEYEGVVCRPHGEKYNAHYQLRLKRQVDLFFDKVKSVKHFYPVMDEETEQVIVDGFLEELLNRRSGQEFKNIVFSIQKKQGEIIQTPFKQNLIVQGCAGSGKSMIMLHRLPIVLYDNPNSLDRNNLYIITPSTAYIQMANNMRQDLEIEDLKMGTLEQYYNYVIKKYRHDPKSYGTIKPYLKLKRSDLEYVYSEQCIKDIQEHIEQILDEGAVNYKKGQTLLSITDSRIERMASTPLERIRREVVQCQNVVNENDSILSDYHRKILDIFLQIEQIARMLETRKNAILRSIARMRSAEEKTIQKMEKEISKIDDFETHKIMYQNRLNVIKVAENKIMVLKETQEIVEHDDLYFEKLNEKARNLRGILDLFPEMNLERSKMSLKEQYDVIGSRDFFIDQCIDFLQDNMKIEDPYQDYVSGLSSEIRKLGPMCDNLENNFRSYLSLEYLQELIDSSMYYEDLLNHGVRNIYLFFMKQLGQKVDEKGRVDALECSPYLYLQILYQFNGLPNGSRESLITIDEAQNIAPQELKLIKSVNGNQVIFNLFGDVKQHIEGSKGVDDWKKFSEIANFKKEYMQENYRNARQITEFCNRRFKGLNMRVINLDGKGVHELKNKKEFEDVFTGIFQRPQNIGLSCIVVKNKEEASTVLAQAGGLKTRIHNMTESFGELQRTKWNLMTVEQVKGLEFETVFAITGRMSENEKYISYTRALDELYVYDTEIELIKGTATIKQDHQPKQVVKEGSVRKKREKRVSKIVNEISMDNSLTKFFEERGLEVIDDRKKSGYLCVIGSKSKIEPIVSEAMAIYGVTGMYGSGKISAYKDAWLTKSKK